MTHWPLSFIVFQCCQKNWTFLFDLADAIGSPNPAKIGVGQIRKKKLGGQKLVKAVFSCRIEFPITWKAEIGSPNRQNSSRASPSKKLVSKIFEIGAVTTKNGNVTWSKKLTVQIGSPNHRNWSRSSPSKKNWSPKSSKLAQLLPKMVIKLALMHHQKKLTVQISADLQLPKLVVQIAKIGVGRVGEKIGSQNLPNWNRKWLF